ncbi:THAP domain-containing protein 10-like [Heptranchias perlo]|uniref:THAP domain-containing protein 10-like n=1 Tax=Heptranchias perlo TaxID=212740 RepID=UPI00355A9BE6
MPRRCVVYGCGNTSKNEVSLHAFPRDAALCEVWVRFVAWRRPKFRDSPHSVICSAHFRPHCFDTERSELMSRFGIPVTSRRKLKVDAVPTVANDLPSPCSKRKKTLDASAEESRKTVVHQLFDTSTSVTYTIHETVDEERLKNANGTPSLNTSSEQCTQTTSVPTVINCLPSPLSGQSTSVPSVINCIPPGLNEQFYRINQMHNKKIQTTIKPKVRTVGIQVTIGEKKKLLASRETQTDWTFQPPFPVQDYSCSVKTEVIDAV